MTLYEPIVIEGPHSVGDLALFLVGSWKMTRHVTDLRNDIEASLKGVADVSVDGVGLVQEEHGTLSVGDRTLESSCLRRYLLQDLARAHVVFEDGRPFHDLDLTNGRWDVEHRCGDDRYAGQFVVLDADVWAVTWLVTGPTKTLELTSRYRRTS